jgi:hypothetical protein
MKYYNNTWTYSAVVVFDNPTIYLDKEV